MSKIKTTFKKIDVLPMVKHYMNQLGIFDIFDKYVPNVNGADIAPAQVLCMLVMNIIVAPKPLYKVDGWATDYLDGITKQAVISGKYNDDRIGRDLENLFGSDCDSIMTETSANAIRVYELETKIMQNDTTSITFLGQYENQNPEALHITHGFNKDHRPDCKQIVFGLNTTEDGHVPISYHAYNGNQADVNTHIPNWDGLRKQLATEDFIYIADSKLCTIDNLHHIDKNDGKFITIMPKNRKESVIFRERLQQGEEISWQPAYSTEHSRKKGEVIIYQTFSEETSWEGYPIIWVHSSSKEKQDYSSREQRICKAEKELNELLPKLNKYKLKSKEQIEGAISKARKGSGDFIEVELLESIEIKDVQKGGGRPGPNTKYTKKKLVTYHIQWERNEEAIGMATRTDGIFPLITNTELPAAEVLQAYKKQPFLEKRFYTTKSILEVAPMFLKKNERIQAMLFLYFIALMVVSLIERNIRKQMEEMEIDNIAILPERRKTERPTWNNICYFFRNLHIAIVTAGEHVISSAVNGMTELHRLVCKLLQVPIKVYECLQDGWWNFELETGADSG